MPAIAMMMKKFGNVSMQAQPGELGGPLMQLIVGAVLIYFRFYDADNSLFGGGAQIMAAAVLITAMQAMVRTSWVICPVTALRNNGLLWQIR